MKLSPPSLSVVKALSVAKASTVKQDPVVGVVAPFRGVIEKLISSEKALKASFSAVPFQLRGLMDLQRGSYMLQLQVECASRVADSITSSVKKIQQLGGQG